MKKTPYYKFLLKYWHFIAIACIGLLVYANSFFNGFVWDDFDQVVRNDAIRSLKNVSYFFSGSTFYSGGGQYLIGLYYKPLMPLSFALMFQLFKLNASFYHVVQVGIHITNCIFVFLIFKHFFKKSIAFIAALVFLVHPVNSESVLYISALQDVLFFFFGVIALYILIYKDIKRYYIAIVGLLLLASLLSKETGVLFLIISLVYILIYKRGSLLNMGATAGAVLGIYVVLRLGMAQVAYKSIGLAPIIRASIEERIYTIPKIILYYLQTSLFPNNLAISQHWVVRELTLWDFYLPLGILVLLLGVLANVGFLFYSKKRQFLTFIFFTTWAVIGFGLHSNIVPLDMTVADRWFYFTFVGCIGIIATILNSLNIKRKNVLFNISVVCTIILILLGVRTIVRTFDWRDIHTLYIHDAHINKESFDLENNIGVSFYRRQNYEEAEKHFKNSVDLAPYWYTNWHNLGLILEREKKYKQAEESYQKSLKNSGGAYFSYITLSRFTMMYGNPKDSRKIAQDGLKRYPANWELWLILSLSEYKLKNLKESEAAVVKSLQLEQNPKNSYIFEQLKTKKPIDINQLYFFR